MAAPAQARTHQKSAHVQANSHQQNIALMKKIGATSYDPIPPDQHRWQAEQRDVSDCEIKLWSWVIQGTLAHESGRGRSAYVVDDRGKELHIEDAAEFFGWSDSNARKYLCRLIKRKVVRTGTGAEGKKRIYITGKVPHMSDLGEIDWGEDKENKKALYGAFPPFICRQIERLPEADRKAFLARWQQTEDRVKQVQADVMEAARTITEQIEDNTFAEFGIRKIRIVRRDEERRVKDEQRLDRIKPLIRVVEKFVQSCFSFDAEICTDSKSVPVQSSASLLTKTENYQREKVHGSTEAVIGSGSSSARDGVCSSDVRLSAMNQGMQAGMSEADACVPAESAVPLAALRNAFPGEVIADRSLNDLGQRLATQFQGLYDPGRFVAAVFDRQSRGQAIRFGLLQRFELGYFVADYFEEERRTAGERREAAERADVTRAAMEAASQQREAEVRSAEAGFAALSDEERQAARKKKRAELKQKSPEFFERMTREQIAELVDQAIIYESGKTSP